MKKSSIIIFIIMLELILMPIFSYAEFYDLSYPPDNKGKADYTDQEADKEKSLDTYPTSTNEVKQEEKEQANWIVISSVSIVGVLVGAGIVIRKKKNV